MPPGMTDTKGEHMSRVTVVTGGTSGIGRGIVEKILAHSEKGDKIFVAGELQNRSYDAQDGTKRYVTEIIINECEFLGTKSTEPTTEQEVDLQPINDDNLPF